MANQPTKTVEFHGVDAGQLGLCLDSAGKVVAVDSEGYEQVSLEVRPATPGSLGTWVGKVRQSDFPGGGFAFASGDTVSDGTRGLSGLAVSTPFLVLHTTTVQAGKAFDVTFHLSTKSE